jgi:diguanylate cyclase (GGDEF)-like protein
MSDSNKTCVPATDTLVITDDTKSISAAIDQSRVSWNYMAWSRAKDLVASFLTVYRPQAIVLDAVGVTPSSVLNMVTRLRVLKEEHQLFLMVLDNNAQDDFIAALCKAGISDVTSRDDRFECLIHRVGQGVKTISNYRNLMNDHRRLEMAQRLANIGSWEWLPSEDVMSWSQTTFQLLGIKPYSKPATLETLIESLDPVDQQIIREKMQQALLAPTALQLECRLNPSSGLDCFIQIVAQPYFDGENFICMDGYIQDITDQKQNESRLQELAFKDSLTGLDNRHLLSDRLKRAIDTANRRNQKFSILFLDLDGFKQINDSFGHEQGDQLLIKVADRLSNLVRSEDSIARLGGDEFCILLNEHADDFSAVHVAQKVIDSFNHPFDLKHASIVIGVSIGISVFPNDGLTLQALFKSADTAMYNAKNNGKNQFSHYSKDMTEQAIQRLELEQAMQQALNNQDFDLYYQPKASLIEHKIIGVEALLRWDRPGHGFISPDIFIPVAEAIGLIARLGNWVLQTACRQLANWHAAGLKVSMAVNISPLQLEHASFVETVIKTLKETGLSAEYLELEITESGIQVSDLLIERISYLRAMGVKIAIDDFGTGYSSLSSLKNLPVDILKIDKEFVRHIPDDANDSAMVASIVGMAKTLGLDVVAEGVETLEQLEYLDAIHCDIAQGYFIGRPDTVAEVENKIEKNILPPDIPFPGIDDSVKSRLDDE